KIRVGRLIGGGPVHLAAGQGLTIAFGDFVGDATRVSCSYAGLARDVRPGNSLLLDDGRLRLTVLSANGYEVEARVDVGGPLGEHKGINLPGVAISAPALTEADRVNLVFGLRDLKVDYVALSFVRTAREVNEARTLIREHGCQTPVVVKIEKGEAIENLDAIIAAADGVMVARGDLAVELAPERVPPLQKRIIHAANARGIPVITATQMLESMVTEELPTRAEATDIANAVWDGTDAVMLSEETASGRHPVLAVQMMGRIIREAEAAQISSHEEWLPDSRSIREAAITRAARTLAEDLHARAIISVTRSGLTVDLLSRERPRVPIYAFAADEAVCRRLALLWGVTAVNRPRIQGLQANVAMMERHLLDHQLVQPGDIVLVVGAQPLDARHHANFVEYHVVDDRPSRGPNGSASGTDTSIALEVVLAHRATTGCARCTRCEAAKACRNHA
ncbi:MAG: Pyruvate kinase, partial [Chloroflexi bacterium]|nr:Pyruvate kinase [Chloroflexota bacterium]